MAVGIDDATAGRMRDLCKPKHCTFLHARDVGQLRVHLREVAKRLRVHLTVRDSDGTTTSTVIEGQADKVMSKAAKLAPSVAPRLARALGMGSPKGAKSLMLKAS